MNNIISVNTHKVIAQACVERLKRVLGKDVEIELKTSLQPEGGLELRIGSRPPLKQAVQMKIRLTTRNQALHSIFQIQRRTPANGNTIVFAEWITEPAGEEFRKAGIFYTDSQGNIFFNKPPCLMIDIRGCRPDHPSKAEPGRLIEPSGLKVVHYLLTNPNAIERPLRAIAEGAHVALGTAHIVLRELERLQWLLPKGEKGRRWGDKKALVELFVRGYALKLRPACLIGCYRHSQKHPQDILEGFAKRLAKMTGRWAVTGGIAAAELTHYFDPDTLTLFVDAGAQATIEKEPMLRDQLNGNVTLLRMFAPNVWGGTTQSSRPLATPFLVYAELLQDGRPREVETAKMIYDQWIEPENIGGPRNK